MDQSNKSCLIYLHLGAVSQTIFLDVHTPSPSEAAGGLNVFRWIGYQILPHVDLSKSFAALLGDEISPLKKFKIKLSKYDI